MRITKQILGVKNYGTERENVVFCADGMEDAKKVADKYALAGPFTLCRVRIIEVMEVVG